MDQNANKVNKFWKGYYEAVVESGIPEKTAEWYANWAQKFAVSIKGTPLRSRAPEDVYSFLADLEECRAMLKDALHEMLLAYKDIGKEIPLGNALIEQLPVEVEYVSQTA